MFLNFLSQHFKKMHQLQAGNRKRKFSKLESKAQVESTAFATAEDAAMPKGALKTKQRQKETR